MALTKYELEVAKRKRETKENIAKAIKLLSDEANIMGNEKVVQEALLESINNTHRTIQQTMWGCIFKVMKEYGNQPSFCFDPRNEAVGKACKELGEKASDYPIPYI